MRALQLQSVIAVAAAACIASGCAAYEPSHVVPMSDRTNLTAQARSWMDPAVRTSRQPLLYVADYFAADVRIYMEVGFKQRPVGEITSGIGLAAGLFVDTKRNLWVANWTGSEGEILRYPKGSTSPNLVLFDSYGAPTALWVARDETVYAVSYPTYGPSEIVKYPQGSSQYQVLGDPNMQVLNAVVGDAKGNLYAGGLPYSGYGEVDELPAGQNAWQNTGIITNAPSALAIDAAGNLLVSADAFLTFPIGKTRPSNRIRCFGTCEQVAFDSTGKHLWGIELYNESGPVNEFDYPSGKRIDHLRQPRNSLPDGVAVTPPLFP